MSHTIQENPDQSSIVDSGASQLNDESMKIVLELFKDEYNAEHERANPFETRSGILITLAGAILAFEAQNFVIPKKGNIAEASLLVSYEIISLILLVGSMIALIKVVSTRTFYRVEPKFFRENSSSYFDQPSTVIGILIKSYSDAIKETSKGSDTRSRWYTVGLWLLVVGLICVTVSRVISLYIGS